MRKAIVLTAALGVALSALTVNWALRGNSPQPDGPAERFAAPRERISGRSTEPRTGVAPNPARDSEPLVLPISEDASRISEETSHSMSDYQARVAAPTIRVLREIEESARARGEDAVLAQVQVERRRVLSAAQKLPSIPPDRLERNEP